MDGHLMSCQSVCELIFYGKIKKRDTPGRAESLLRFGASFERCFLEDAAIGTRGSSGYGIRESMCLPSVRFLCLAGEALGSLGAPPTMWLQQDRAS